MSARSPIVTLLLSTALAGAAAPTLAQQAPTQKVDVPETVEVVLEESDGKGTEARTYLAIGLSVAAVIGLLLLVVLLARAGDRNQVHHPH